MEPRCKPEETVEEWKTRELPGITLSGEDRRLCERLGSGSGPKLEILELRDGLRIRAFSWVGVVELSGLRIRIEPKLAGDHVGVARLLDWTAGIGSLRQLGAETTLDFAGDSLFDLMVRLLVEATERLIRSGLRTAYVEYQDTLRVLRGRLDFERQIRRQHGRIDLLDCRFDDRSSDILDNQLLLAAAVRCAPHVKDLVLRRRVDRIRAILSESCTLPQHGLERSTFAYDRLNNHYRPGHQIARLILEGSRGLESFYKKGATRSFAFMIDMNRLFEMFVERLLTELLGDRGVLLRFQKKFKSVVQREDGSPYRRLIPDTLLTVPRSRFAMPIDAKYKRYSNKNVEPSDIARTFLYAFGLGEAPNQEPRQAMILYPSETRQVDAHSLQVHDPAGIRQARITALGLPIVGILTEMSLAEDQPHARCDQVAKAVLGTIPGVGVPSFGG